MTIAIVIISLAILILLITWAKFNPFLAFLIVSLLAGWLLKIPVEKLTTSIKNGIGNIMGELVIIICLGAMLGKLVAESGAAQKIADASIKVFGKKHFHWAMMVTGFVVGIPLFYNVGFVLLRSLTEQECPLFSPHCPCWQRFQLLMGFCHPILHHQRSRFSFMQIWGRSYCTAYVSPYLQ